MQVSLHYTPTANDFRQLFARCPRPRWSRLLRLLGAALLVAFALWRLVDEGLGLGSVMPAFLGLWLAAQTVLSELFMSCMMALFQTRVSVDMDEDRIITTWTNANGKQTGLQTIPWTSFSQFGKAVEYPTYFLLESGRGGVWIPKHAFPTESQVEEFRSLLSGKMGDRAQLTVTGLPV